MEESAKVIISYLTFKELKKQDIDSNWLTFNELKQLKERIKNDGCFSEEECKLYKEITKQRKQMESTHTLSEIAAIIHSTSESHFSEVLFFPVQGLYCTNYYENGICEDMGCKRTHDKEKDNAIWKLEQYLSGAKESIDLCLLTFSVNEYAKAIVNAMIKNNIKVRMLVYNVYYEHSKKEIDFLKENGAEIVFVTQRCLHHKFILIDNKIVITGSYNFTYQGTFHNYENTVVTNKPGLLQPFIHEFNELCFESKHGSLQERKSMLCQSNSAEINKVYFFPERHLPCQFYLINGCTENHEGDVSHDSSLIHICSELLKTKKELNLCLYDMSNLLLRKILEHLSTKGVKVKMLIDPIRISYSANIMRLLEEKGVKVIPVKTKSLFHHKFILSDNKLVVTGSFNWAATNSVDTYDNIIFTKDPEIVNSFVNEFNKLNNIFENAKDYVKSPSNLCQNKQSAWDGIIINERIISKRLSVTSRF